MTRGVKPRPAAARFWEHVTKTDTCWLWTGATQGNGYGRFNDGTRLVLVHRWSYEHHIGPIPEGLTIDHVKARGCRHTNCVNPAHLEPVTRAVNAWRGNPNKDKTHCDHGHELTPENVYVSPSRPTVRDCRTCRRARGRARYERDVALRNTA